MANNRYVVSYDLVEEEGSDGYKRIIREIRKLGGKKVLQSQWCFRSQASAETLCDYIWEFMDDSDRLLVQSVDGRDWAGYNIINKISEM